LDFSLVSNETLSEILPSSAVVLNLFDPVHPFNCYSQIKFPPYKNLVSKEHFCISTLKRETKLFTIDKLFGL